MAKRKVLKYTVDFDVPPAVLWSVVRNTERLNQAGKTPFTPYTIEERVGADGVVTRHATRRIGPITLRWHERFGEWVEGKSMSQWRHLDNGPYRILAVDLSVAPTPAGSRLDARFTAVWTGYAGTVLTALGVLHMITAPVIRTLRNLVADASQQGPALSPAAYKAPAPGAVERARLDRAAGKIEATRYGHGLAPRLVDHLVEANPLDLRHLRPLEMARSWGEDPNKVIELFLAAHKADLLSMRWEIMCPRCRGGKSTATTLSELDRNVHCESCQIDYERDFESNVELVFSPEPWVRDLPDGSFCMMGPASTPHIRVQREVPPGGTCEELVDLAPGRYRMRTIEAGGQVEHEHDGGGFPEIVITAGDVAVGETHAAGTIVMSNYSNVARTVVVESTAWSDIALTGPKVIAGRAFRDLCPEQLLRPGDEVAIGQVAILFSDLSESTALYERVGDARAYALVRSHFEFLEERIGLHSGTVVKTIGDAVMAAFPDGSNAVAAALAMQDDVRGFNTDRVDGGIELKIGLHVGSCIAVTSHGVLDYFGTNVNIAARLQGHCRGGEIVLSDRLMENSAVRDLLADRNTDKETARLHGVSDRTVVHRVTRG